jgi:hypothetical protein
MAYTSQCDLLHSHGVLCFSFTALVTFIISPLINHLYDYLFDGSLH